MQCNFFRYRFKESIEYSQREVSGRVSELKPTSKTLDEDLDEAGAEAKARLKSQEMGDDDDEETIDDDNVIEQNTRPSKKPGRYDITGGLAF